VDILPALQQYFADVLPIFAGVLLMNCRRFADA